MSIYRDKKAGCFVFTFDRRIKNQRVRSRKRLPKAWSHAQADTYDRQESARIYAIAEGIERPEFLIDEAVEVYIKERVPELKSGQNVISELAQMFWAYQGRPISALADVCKQYMTREREKFAPATIKNRIRYLTSACRYAWKHHNMCESDPAGSVIVPVVKNARQVYINRAQMIQLAKACTSLQVRAIIRIAFYSGMRMSEILHAEIARDFFFLRDTKNGEPRYVPIHPKVRTAVKHRSVTVATIKYHFMKARTDVDMEWLRFHDLRHSAASELRNNGVDLHTVGGILGHKSADSTKRYAHIAPNTLMNAVLKIGKKVA